jgi:hypothetical protein
MCFDRVKIILCSNGWITIQILTSHDSDKNQMQDLGRLSRQHNFCRNMLVTKSKLSDPYFKQLLLDIEKSNLLRDDLTFGTICRLRPNYYDTDENLKKKYKSDFDQIKRRTESAYIKLLDSFSIPVGAALQRTLRKKNKPPSASKKPASASKKPASASKKPVRASSDSSSSSSASSSSSSSVSSSSEDEEESVAKITERLKDISIPKGIVIHKEIERIEQTPPISSLKKKKIMFSPDTESATSNPIGDVLNFVELLESIRQDGTYEYPFIHIVNQEYPERNHGFDIVLVPEIEHRGHTRDAFHIRKTVSAGNTEDWEAFLPSTRYPTLADRAVMVRGPSQDFFIKNTEKYHEDVDNIDCAPTKKKHSATEQAIKDDPSRQLEHTLLIFKKGIKLENHIFSDDAVFIDVEVNDMMTTIDNDGEELEIMGTTLFWCIAVAGGSKLASGKPKKGKKLFKK